MNTSMGDVSEKNEGAIEQPRYVIEPARSGASKCKTCRHKIAKEALRLGILVDGFYGPGYMWHHIECAAQRMFEQVEEAYEMEAWKVAKSPPEGVPSLEELRTVKAKAEDRRRQKRTLPYAEVAPSGRSRCKKCGEPIEKGSVRVALAKEVRFGGQARVGPMNVHPRCVPAALEEEEVVTELESLRDELLSNSRDIDTARIEQAVSAIDRAQSSS